MDLQPESGKQQEQIVSQFLLKVLHIILDSRIPSLHERSSVSRVKKSNRWFNLLLGDRPAGLDNLNSWQRNRMDPMIIDIVLVHQSTETVIERWVVHYDSTRPPLVSDTASSSSSSPHKKTYRKSIILLRSLYAYMRLLPAYRVFRQLSSSQNSNFDIRYKVSSFTDPLSRAEEEFVQEYFFVPVEAYPGRLSVSVTYRSTLSDFNLELLTSSPPKIITDYVGSPSSTDPIRSFPLRGIRPPLQRPHSWTSGFHGGAAIAAQSPQPFSANRNPPTPSEFASSPTDIYGYRVQNHRPLIHQKTISYDEYQFSPPFSPYPSPSPPAPMHTRLRSETAPVSIPHTVSSRGSRCFSPSFCDQNRHSLPPPSPRSIKHDPSSQESSIGNRSGRRTAELHYGAYYSGHKMMRDNRDDSGRFSGLLSSSGSPRVGFSRSSSRLSLQDDLDDCGFSYPFDVDDVEASDSPSSQNLDGRSASESHSVGTISQDAAVGAFVRMLRAAPPLRQDSSCYSSHSMRIGSEEGVAATASGFFVPRKTADALEELNSYRDMKDLLLSKSGNRIITRAEG